VSRQEPHARSLKPEQTDRLNWTKVQHQTRDGRQAVGSRRSCADFMFIGCSLRKRTRVQLRRGLRPRQGSTVTAPYRASPLSNRIPERHEESRGLGWCHCTFTISASIGPRSNAHCKGRRSATGLRHRLRRRRAHRTRVSTLQRSLSARVSSFRAGRQRMVRHQGFVSLGKLQHRAVSTQAPDPPARAWRPQSGCDAMKSSPEI